jgi:hypothetical protein
MRIIVFLTLLCLGFPLWAQEHSSLRVDLSLYKTAPCFGESDRVLLGPQRLTPSSSAFTNSRSCLTTRNHHIPTDHVSNHWEASTTAWLTFPGKKKQFDLGIGLDFATGNKHQTFKLRGRRIMFEVRW